MRIEFKLPKHHRTARKQAKEKKRAGGSFYVYKNIYNWIIDEFDVENLSTHSLMTVQIFDHAQFNDALV